MELMVYGHVGFEVLTAAVVKSCKFWDITPCGPLKINKYFGGTCCVHLQGRRKSQARNQKVELYFLTA
jgi:hypothetical protein